MNLHHRMLGPPESMPSHYNLHHGSNLPPPPPPPHPHMYKMMPPHATFDAPGMMLPSHPSGSSRPSKGLPTPSSDPMQQHHHMPPPPHYVKMHSMDPLLGPPHGHHHHHHHHHHQQQQQHMRFAPVMDDSFSMGPPPPSSHMHPHMHPYPMHPNDVRPPPQSINNTYVSTTMSIQQLNIQNLGPSGPPSELQPGTIHYHASSANTSDAQQQQGLSSSNGNSSTFPSQQQFTSMNNISTNESTFASQFNDLPPPSNLSVDGTQPPSYW